MQADSHNNNKTINSPFESRASLGFFLLCIYTALVLIRPHEWPIFSLEFPLLRSILICTFIVYLVALRPKIWNVQCTIMVLLFFSMLMSEMRSGRFFSDLEYVIDWLSSNVIPFVLYLGFLASIKRQRIILVISLIAALIMVLQAYSQITDPLGQGWAESAIYRYDSADEVMQTRYVGIFNDPNDMGMFLLMNLPVAAYFLVISKGWLGKAASLTTIGLILLGIYWTGSRGSLVGLLAVFAAFFYIRFGKVKSIVIGVLCLPVVLFLLASFRSISTDDESAQDRLTAWYEGVQMFKYRPLFGFGKGRFLEYHAKVAHNSYVTMMSELGISGFVLWMMFVFLIFFMIIRVIRLPKLTGADEEALQRERTLNVYLLVSIIGFCSTAFFISRSYAMFFYTFAAIAAASYYRVQKTYPQFSLEIKGYDILRIFIWSCLSLGLLYMVVRLLLNV